MLLNGLTLALSLSFLILILWHDSRRLQNQFFSVFLAFLIVWTIGSFTYQFFTFAFTNTTLGIASMAMLEFGFIGSSIGLYLFMLASVGMQKRRFIVVAYLSLALLLFYRGFLIVIETTTADFSQVLLSDYRFHPLFSILYVMFAGATLFIAWRYRRKLNMRGVMIGVVVFIIGQGLIFLNPRLSIASFATTVSSIGALIIGFSILRQQIIIPLSERTKQMETMHQVSLAMSSQLAIETVLREISQRAAQWLNADGVGIFLMTDGHLRLAAMHELPAPMFDIQIERGQGIIGRALREESVVFLENYARDWHEKDELPLARETFGSIIAAPMIYNQRPIGVLMVVAAKHGKLFDDEDVRLSEMLSAQAAVAISHSQLFNQQRRLMIEVEEARNQLETVLSGTDNPVIAIDRNCHVIFANPAVQRLFDIKIGNDIRQTLPKQVFPTDAKDAFKDIKRQGTHVYEMVLYDKHYLCYVAPLIDQSVRGFVAVLNDVSELKELDRLKSEMVRMASHDLKNPLMGAVAYLDLLREDVPKSNIPQSIEYIDIIEQQLERMNRIIRGILDIERMTTETLLKEACNPAEIVESALAELRHNIHDKEISIETKIKGENGAFWGDSKQFERALVNLIENAIKFTPISGQVLVEVSTFGNQIVFCIADNGVGIPKEIQPRIFDRFFRGNQHGVEHVTGTGLGLSLVKAIVEAHNGRIEIESQVGSGTRVEVKLPKISSHSQ